MTKLALNNILSRYFFHYLIINLSELSFNVFYNRNIFEYFRDDYLNTQHVQQRLRSVRLY